uniref:Protein kinase domain-containing protein n=1 Tax=viral metagenome TaxID=1070528 RepID=A0A6C0LJD5_9ZZZZ
MNEFFNWLKHEYFDQIDVNTIDGSKNYKNMINDSISFPLNRMMTFINLKYTLSMKTSGYTYVPFRLNDKKTSIIFAVIYFLDDIPKFVCMSPTYISTKGEFRDGFIEYSQLEYVFNNYSKELIPIENHVRDKLSKGQILLEYEFYPESKIIDEDISMLGFKLLIGSLYLLLYKRYNNQIQIHTDKLYLEALKDIDKIDIKNYNKDIYNFLFKGNLERPYGQKLIPLSVGEAIKINNISYSSWRELFISYATSDMVINGISPNFAISANWSYIEGADKDMFDNPPIKEKYIQNEEVIKVISKLKELYRNSENIFGMDVQREKIYDTITNLSSYKLLSNIAIARIDEFAGATIGTIPYAVKNADVMPKKYKLFLSNVTVFDKVIFDLFYACHVLHKKIGVVHLDLHLNNITILDDTLVSSGHTMYILNGQQETYFFPYEGFYGTVIDFSDAVVSEKFLDFTDKYTTIDSFENIIDREKDYIFDKLSSMLLYVKKNKDKVKGKIISDYNLMFKAFSAIDFVSISKNIRMMLERDLGDYVSKDIIRRITELENISLEHLLSSIQDVVDGRNVEDVKFVGDILLPKFFEKYTYENIDNLNDIKIINIYNFNSVWRHSGVSYEQFPVWAKKDYIEKKFGKKKADEIFGRLVLPEGNERDVHLAYLIEKLSTEYGSNVIQTQIKMEEEFNID